MNQPATIQNLKFVNIFLIFLFMHSSCSNRLHHYGSNDATILSLRKKNDVHVSGSTYSINPKSDKNNQNIQVGYSPIKHVAVAGNYFRYRDFDPNNSLQFSRGNFKELTIGGYYYFPINNNNSINEKSSSNSFLEKGALLDIYYGLGKGTADNFFENNGTSSLLFNKNHVQCGFHLFNKNFGLSYIFKRLKLNYNKAILFGDIPDERILDYRDLEEQNAFSAFENTFKFFIRNRKMQFFSSISIIEGSERFSEFGYAQSNINIGITVEIDEFFRGRKKR